LLIAFFTVRIGRRGGVSLITDQHGGIPYKPSVLLIKAVQSSGL